MTRSTLYAVAINGDDEPLTYQFLDSNGDPYPLGDRFVGVTVTRASPTEDTEFRYSTPIVQKLDADRGIVRLNWVEDPTDPTSPSIFPSPGEYVITIWAYEWSTPDQTTAVYDVGVYDSAQYDEVL